MSPPTRRILFVCLGNICRSPLAEAVFRQRARERGAVECFQVDSAGMSGWHDGEPPDGRSVAAARSRGVEVHGSSRRVTPEELADWDLIIAMDGENLAELRALAERTGARPRLHRLREWDPAADSPDVPDPYFGGEEGFGRVQEIVERSVAGLLDHLLAEEAAR